MPINSTSAFYAEKKNEWKMIEDIYAGESTIKAAGELYCPKLDGMTENDYPKYIDRGTFFNATYRTHNVMMGVLFAKPPVIVNEDIIPKEVMDNITSSGDDIKEFLRLITDKLVEYGYCGVLTDMNEEGNPYLALYSATSILNYQVITNKKGESKLELLVLGETVEVPTITDPYVNHQIQQIRLLYLDEEGLLVVEVYQLHPKDAKSKDVVWIKVEETIYPQIRGKRIDSIPFTFFGTNGNTHIPPKPPLLDLAYLNIKHWQVSVDYYHGIHYCAMPTPWMAGFNGEPGSQTMSIGPGTALRSDDPQARCGYLEFTGQGLTAVRTCLEDLKAQMAIVGARALEMQKKTAEAADTVARYQSADEAILATIAIILEAGMKQVMKNVGLFLSIKDTSGVRIALNTDFLTYEITPEAIRALLEAAQAGYISIDTFLWNLKQGDALPDDRDIQQEKDLINSELKEMGLKREDIISAKKGITVNTETPKEKINTGIKDKLKDKTALNDLLE